MNTYSNAPTRNWNLPSWGPGGALLALVLFGGVGWFLLSPGPVAVLSAEDVDGPWPFAASEVEVHCRTGRAFVEIDGTPYALSTELRSAPDLATLDLDTDDGVWLRRDDGTKVPLQPARAVAEQHCR